jgi:GYF domain 2
MLDTTAPPREWLFKDEGQVFGPITHDQLVELVLQGKVDAATQVAAEDGSWRSLGSVSGFLVHLKKAEVRARVEAEVTGSRNLARRRTALQSAAAALALLLLIAAAGTGAWLLATKRPWERRSKLLDDFGDGIAIGAVRVGSGPRAVSASEDEIAVPDLTEASREGAGRARRTVSPARPARSGASAQGGDLVLAQYDPARIRDVVARRQGSLAPCLREEARRSPEFAGEIPLEFAVGNDGKVVALWIDEPRFKSGPMRDCVFAKLREWTFDSFPGERPVVSLVFKLGR